MRAIIPILFAASALCAQSPSPDQVEGLADRLGAEEFKQRVEAERSLMEQTRLRPESTVAALEKRLLHETDPEIRTRIRRILEIVARSTPLEKLAFTKDSLAAKQWERLGDLPKKARYTLDGELLEIHSLDSVEEGMAFVHRFADRGGEADPRNLFGARPLPDPERLVLDVEVRTLKEHHIRDGLAGMHLNVEDHRASAGLMILKDGIFLYRHNVLHKMDTSDRWHHFRFVIEGNRQRIFVDDMKRPVFDLERPKQAGRQWATFGDGSAGAGVHARIRNVTISRYSSDAKPR